VKKRRFVVYLPALRSIALLSLIFFLCPLPAAAQGSERTPETIMEYYDTLVKQGMDSVENLLKSTKREKSEVEAVWDDLNERFISVFSKIGHIEFDSLVKKERNESKATRASEWGHDMTLFIHDLQTVGEVVAWQRKVNREIFQLEFDIECAPRRQAGYSGRLKEYGGRLETIDRELKGGSLSSSEIQKRLDEVKTIRTEAENVSGSVLRAIERLEENLTLKPEMDKRIEKILENWSNMKARHPNVKDALSDAPPGWVPLVKKHWQNLETVREKFHETYGPLLEGKLFKDVPVFRDKKYEDLAKPATALEVDLKTALASAARKEKSAEELRREIERDEELTKQEIRRLRELRDSVSPEKRWALQLEDARAAGGVARVRELQLVMSRNPDGSAEYRKASEEARLIQEEKHPEQLAVKKKLREFEELERKVSEEIRKIREEHEKRRKSLGLTPGLN